MTVDTTNTKGCGDVFADLGFSLAEARNLRLRSRMMTALRKFIEKEGLTQADAAARLNVSRFSLDRRVWRSRSGSGGLPGEWGSGSPRASMLSR